MPPALMHKLTWSTVVALSAVLCGCGDDPTTASGDELPLVEGAEVVQSFEVPNGIVDARVLFQVVAGSDSQTASELIAAERALLEDEGWTLGPDRRVPGAWVIRASDDHVEDFIRFGTVEAMKEAAMSRPDQRHINVPSVILKRSMVVQISPPGPPQPGQ